MKKLTPDEEHALAVLRKYGSWCPGRGMSEGAAAKVVAALDTLVKKKRATVEMTDDGPRYHAAP